MNKKLIIKNNWHIIMPPRRIPKLEELAIKAYGPKNLQKVSAGLGGPLEYIYEDFAHGKRLVKKYQKGLGKVMRLLQCKSTKNSPVLKTLCEYMSMPHEEKTHRVYLDSKIDELGISPLRIQRIIKFESDDESYDYERIVFDNNRLVSRDVASMTETKLFTTVKRLEKMLPNLNVYLIT